MCNSHKKTILAWITYILTLVVLLPIVAFLFLLGTASWGNPILPAIGCLAVFGLWGYNQYDDLIRKNPNAKNKKSFMGLLTIAILTIIIPLAWLLRGCGLISPYRPQTIHAADFRQAKSMLKNTYIHPEKMIPISARDIDFHYEPGFAPMAYLKCSCSESELQEFGIAQGYAFQGDNLFKNSATDNPVDINGFSIVLNYFHAEEATSLHELKNALAYTCIHRNGGGFVFLYIVDKQLLYGFYSHH